MLGTLFSYKEKKEFKDRYVDLLLVTLTTVEEGNLAFHELSKQAKDTHLKREQTSL